MYINSYINTPQPTNSVNKITPVFKGNATGGDVVDRSFATKTSHVLENCIDNVVGGNVFSIVSKIKLKKLLSQLLPDIKKTENFINSGFESSVYKISDKYVLKVPNDDSEQLSSWYNFPTCPNKHFAKLDFYYGEPLVKCGEIEILKNATPTDNYVCCGLKYKSRNTEDEIQKYEKEFIPFLSSLPQSSYTDFAKGLKELNSISTQYKESKLYFIPDVMNPNNIIIHDKKIKLVDRLEECHTKEPNDLFMLLEPFLLRYSTEYIPEYKTELDDERRNILKKCLIATEEAELPFAPDDTIGSAIWYRDLMRVEKLTNVGVTPLVDTLQVMRKSDYSLETRLDLINQILS